MFYLEVNAFVVKWGDFKFKIQFGMMWYFLFSFGQFFPLYAATSVMTIILLDHFCSQNLFRYSSLGLLLNVVKTHVSSDRGLIES